MAKFFLVNLVLITFTNSFTLNRYVKINNNKIRALCAKSSKAKGFARVKTIPQPPSSNSSISTLTSEQMIVNDNANFNLPKTTKQTERVSSLEPKQSESMDAVFERFGLKSTEKKKSFQREIPLTSQIAERPFGESIISKLTPKQQQLYESILATSAFVSLSFVVICGIAISVGALRVVFPAIEIASAVDSIIKNILSPSFTPALGFFLLCSTSYGLFKFAQLSSSETVYRED
jgi:hypothetical protein